MANDTAKLSIETPSAKSNNAPMLIPILPVPATALFIRSRRQSGEASTGGRREALRPCQPSLLLPCHRDFQSILWADDVVVSILAQVDLNPIHLARKGAGLPCV